MKTKIILSLLCSFLAINSVSAQPGTLDPTFGDGGIVRHAYNQPPFTKRAEALTVLEQPDGKILAAGYVGNKSVIARFHPDGAVDTLSLGIFGFTLAEGGLLFGVNSEVHSSVINDQVLLPDGKIISVGTAVMSATMAERYFLMRQHADGGLDVTFGADGPGFGNGFVVGNNDSFSGLSVALRPDGKILIAGNSNTYGTKLARYLPGGQLDSTFATNGIFSVGGLNARTMLLLPDGKIVVGGTGNSWTMGLGRFHPDATPDTSFGTNGFAFADLTDQPDIVRSLAILPDGDILAIGSAGDNLAVAKFSEEGLDMGYGTNGAVFVSVADKKAVGKSAALQPDGKLVVVGNTWLPGDLANDFLLARFTEDGSLDADFGDGGTVLYGSDQQYERLNAAVLIGDKHLLVAGIISKQSVWDTDFIVARYQLGIEVDAPVTPTPAEGMIVIQPNPTTDYLNFQLRGGNVGRTASFRITDMQGRVLRTFESGTPGATHIVPVWDWAAGVYFLQYVEEGKVRASERFVVVR